jgi:hypothetical protein
MIGPPDPRDTAAAELREAMSRNANATRDLADEFAGMFGGCDDPLHPHELGVFRDWVDFVERVARPIAEGEGDQEAEQAAMRLYRQASPFSICTALVMMANRLDRLGDRPGEVDL